VNWANQKTQGAPGGMPMIGRPVGPGYGGAPAPMNFGAGPLSYESIVQQTSPLNTTVYVGNLVPYCTQADLIPLFQSIGYVSEIRMQADRGFAFVKLDTHENAAMAIVQLQGQAVHGRPIKCSWGKDRASESGAQPGGPAAAVTSYSMPMYGMPQASAYGAYGFGGYGGFPNAATGISDDPSGAAGLSQATAGLSQMMPGVGGLAADAGMASAGPWGAADQSAAAQQQAYYNQYYGYYNQAGGQAAGGQGPGMP